MTNGLQMTTLLALNPDDGESIEVMKDGIFGYLRTQGAMAWYSLQLKKGKAGEVGLYA